MKIDAEQLNYLHNKLKSLVGEQGAFILFAVKPDGEGEDLQIRFVGPDTRVVGLLEGATQVVEEYLKKKFTERITQLPREPD